MFSIEDYNYELPGDLIAQTPAEKRDDSRLLRLGRHSGDISHHRFFEIENFIDSKDVLVVNNTKVIPARLFGEKETGGKIEVLLLGFAQGSASQTNRKTFECDCLIRASKRPAIGSRLYFDRGLTATVKGFKDGFFRVGFLAQKDFSSTLYRIGHVPLPPYIKRDPAHARYDDTDSYQTVYASQKGAVAAPTAGLHFSEALLAKLRAKGVKIVEITLHVGYGTFLPVRSEDIRNHRIHSEWFGISGEAADSINRAKSTGGRVIAVGTTSVRTLEHSADLRGKLHPGSGQCDLFIYPGYRYRMVDAMITNYHLPKSTLLMLVSAFAERKRIFTAYREAIKEGYRFYSYGDAMMIA